MYKSQGDTNNRRKPGIINLIDMYRRKFRVEENLENYGKNDLKEAERKFIKYSLSGQLH